MTGLLRILLHLNWRHVFQCRSSGERHVTVSQSTNGEAMCANSPSWPQKGRILPLPLISPLRTMCLARWASFSDLTERAALALGSPVSSLTLTYKERKVPLSLWATRPRCANFYTCGLRIKKLTHRLNEYVCKEYYITSWELSGLRS
jgi:hypothetical protein